MMQGRTEEHWQWSLATLPSLVTKSRNQLRNFPAGTDPRSWWGQILKLTQTWWHHKSFSPVSTRPRAWLYFQHGRSALRRSLFQGSWEFLWRFSRSTRQASGRVTVSCCLPAAPCSPASCWMQRGLELGKQSFFRSPVNLLRREINTLSTIISREAAALESSSRVTEARICVEMVHLFPSHHGK